YAAASRLLHTGKYLPSPRTLVVMGPCVRRDDGDTCSAHFSSSSRPSESASRDPYAAASRLLHTGKYLPSPRTPVVMGLCSRARLRTRQGRPRDLLNSPHVSRLYSSEPTSWHPLHRGAQFLAETTGTTLQRRRIVLCESL